MLVKTYGAAVQGIDAIMITVEVVVDRGSGFVIVGLPDTAVKESGDRVQSAIKQSGGNFPRAHVIVNMSPADVRKEGAAYDLPIAVGILAADGKIPADRLARFIIMGELSLDGSVLPIKGALPMAIMARQHGFEGMIVPQTNATEAAVVNNLDVYG
ncbi:MAG: magnesium chelatase, partial [Muribaculaceae bacterium]|nr:magnesium chelatase [Muribaculaceae bacterium]